MAADGQTDRHTHNFRKCSHASVGLAQARPNYREGVTSAKHEVQAQLLTWSRPDSQILNLVKAIKRERWEIERKRGTNDNDSGRDLNPRPGKWPTML